MPDQKKKKHNNKKQKIVFLVVSEIPEKRVMRTKL